MVQKSWSLKEGLVPAEISQENNSFFLSGDYHLPTWWAEVPWEDQGDPFSRGIIYQTCNFTQAHNTAEAYFTCQTDPPTSSCRREQLPVHIPIHNCWKSCSMHWTCLDHLMSSVHRFAESLHIFFLLSRQVSDVCMISVSFINRAMIVSMNTLWRGHVWNYYAELLKHFKIILTTEVS